MNKILSIVSFLGIGISLLIHPINNTKARPIPKPVAKVNWMSFEKAAIEMKKNPKKVYIDMYTGWCHWCKVMDKKTLSNPKVVQYLNENFYCIKFNAESKQDVTYNGIVYNYDKKRKAHELAIELMNGKLSFPTSIFLEENFSKAQPVPGYLKVRDMEMILKYLAENKNKTTPWSNWQQQFKPKWK